MWRSGKSWHEGLSGHLWESREHRSELASALQHIQQAGGLGGFSATRSRSLALIATVRTRRYVRWNRRRQRYELTPSGRRYIGAPEQPRATPGRFTLVASAVACAAFAAWLATAWSPGTASNNTLAQAVKQSRDLAVVGEKKSRADLPVATEGKMSAPVLAYDDAASLPVKVAARPVAPETARKNVAVTAEPEAPKARKVSTPRTERTKARKVVAAKPRPAKSQRPRAHAFGGYQPSYHWNSCQHGCVQSGM